MSLDRSFDDNCAKKSQESMQYGASDYIMNPNAWMRGTGCELGSLGRYCSSYGPLAGKLVTRDSYLQGRGQALSNCPECEVRWLPEELFAGGSPNSKITSQDSMPLTLTRLPRSCSSVSDIDVTQYAFMPAQYQDQAVGLQIQVFGESSKTFQRQQDMKANEANKNAQKGRTSYGYYPCQSQACRPTPVPRPKTCAS